MLTITSNKTTDPQLHILDTIEPGCWINMIDPPPAEIERVSEELGIPIDYLTYPLDIDERARTEKDEGVTTMAATTPLPI